MSKSTAKNEPTNYPDYGVRLNRLDQVSSEGEAARVEDWSRGAVARSSALNVPRPVKSGASMVLNPECGMA